jgi:CspA family cold shock protein
MATAVVKWFAPDKGFGFLIPDGGGQDVFVHVSSLRPGQTIQEGDRVSYEIGMNRGKSCAVNVSIFN